MIVLLFLLESSLACALPIDPALRLGLCLRERPAPARLSCASLQAPETIELELRVVSSDRCFRSRAGSVVGAEERGRGRR